MEREAGKGEVMEADKRLSQTLVVTRQATESGCPCKASFHHPDAVAV
jgi:hypothetical protein